jgi:transposase
MGRPSKYSPELRERAVRLVFDHASDHPSQWAAIRSVAEKIGCPVEVLRRWVRHAERDAGQRPGLTTDERARLKQLERENVELKRANDPA